MKRKLMICNSCGFRKRIIPELTEIDGEWLLPIHCLECRSLYEIPLATLTCPISDSHPIKTLEVEETLLTNDLSKQLEDDLDKILGKNSIPSSTTWTCPMCEGQLNAATLSPFFN